MANENGVYDFSAPGKSCMTNQGGAVNIGAKTLPVDTELVEDCLYAKIIARKDQGATATENTEVLGLEPWFQFNNYGPLIPEKDSVIASEPRNVLTWIHGGTFNWGGIDATYESPDNLVAENDIIVAKANYRLGKWNYSIFIRIHF